MRFIIIFILSALLPLNAQALITNGDPLSMVQVTLCGAQGLGSEASQLSDAQKKDYAAICAAYHLGAYEVSGSTTHLDVVMQYAKQYHLTVQDIDNETWPNPQTSTFTTDMQRVGKSMESLTQQERERRLAAWSEVAARFFKQTNEQGQRVRPSNLLKLARALRK